MDKAVTDRWLEMLRSGQYKGARLSLYYSGAYSASGLLCLAHSMVFKHDWDPDPKDAHRACYLGHWGRPADQVLEWLAGGKNTRDARALTGHLAMLEDACKMTSHAYLADALELWLRNHTEKKCT